MVIVFGGVVGGAATNIEVDFDQITFTSGAPAVFDETVFDDMEHGDPFGNGWFVFNGAVGGGGIAPNTADLPPALGGVFSLETGWGSGGAAWLLRRLRPHQPDRPVGHRVLQLLDQPRRRARTTPSRSTSRTTTTATARSTRRRRRVPVQLRRLGAGPCAVAGGGWQLVSIPLDRFLRRRLVPLRRQRRARPDSRGPRRQRRIDQRRRSPSSAAAPTSTSAPTIGRSAWRRSCPQIGTIIDDFENGVAPGTACPAGGLPLGFYTFNGGGQLGGDLQPRRPRQLLCYPRWARPTACCRWTST